jgi:hypothetical protein
MRGLASKSTTTWFLSGLDDAMFYRHHFEVANTIQLTYTASNIFNYGLTWYINTAYIM